MEHLNTNKQIGLFLKRNDQINIKIKDLLKELQIILFEADIIKRAIQAIIDNQLTSFDSLIGDRKCQTRASIILDLIKKHMTLKQEISQELINIELVEENTIKLFNSITLFNQIELKQLTKLLSKVSLYDYLNNNKLTYNLSDKLNLLSLCFLTQAYNYKIYCSLHNLISCKKIQKLIIKAKTTLCHISIQYEQTLAQQYSSSKLQNLTQQIETKSSSYMTAFFPSFKAIFEKMKYEQQPFIQKTTPFCSCGGTQKTILHAYVPHQNKFQKTDLHKLLAEQAIMIIEGYTFSGSFAQLKKLLNVPEEMTLIPQESQKSCTCDKTTKHPAIQNIEEVILANFAQHPQFTNNAPIDFERFGLQNSDIKKEFDHLLTVPGCGIDDMSVFCIRHIYPSTVQEVLQQSQQHTETSKQPAGNISDKKII